MKNCARSLSIAILLFVAPLSFAENVLVLSNGTTDYPMHGKNNSGIVEAILSEALKRINYKLVIRALPNERSLINANRGLVDGESQRIAGLEKKYPNWDSIYMAKAITHYILHEPEFMKKALTQACQLDNQIACDDLKQLKRLHEHDFGLSVID